MASGEGLAEAFRKGMRVCCSGAGEAGAPELSLEDSSPRNAFVWPKPTNSSSASSGPATVQGDRKAVGAVSYVPFGGRGHQSCPSPAEM